MFLVLALLLLIFLPNPWNLAAALVSLVLFGVEVLFWNRRVRRIKVRTGVEDLIGATGQVATALAPSGQIKVRGELWEAHSATPLKPGDRVRVLSVDDLRLEVAPDEEGSTGAARATGAALLAVVALLVLAGCGGDDESSSEAYADDVCSSVNTWVEDVEGAIGSIRESGLSTTKSEIETAVQDVASATTNLTEDLRNLGAPDTEAGDQAKSELEDFGNEVERQIETVQTAVASGTSVVSIAATVSTALSQVLAAAQSTYQELQNLPEAGDELQEAFEDSDECDALKEQLDEARSGS